MARGSWSGALFAALESKATETVARHKVTVGVMIGTWLLAGLVSIYTPIVFSWFGGFLLGLVGVGVRWMLRCGWWMRQRGVQLAGASLPAPSRFRMWRQWRQHRKRVAHTRLQWERFCSAHKLQGVGGVIPKLHSITATVSLDLTASVSPGPIAMRGGVDKIESLRIDLAETVGCEEVLVRRTGVGHADLSILWTTQFERVVPVSELPMPTGKNQVVYGVRRDGGPAAFSGLNHVLIAGMTGGGKSGITWSALTSLTMQGIHHDLYASDAKGGLEMRELADKIADRTDKPLRLIDYAPDVDGTIRLIEKFERAMKDRAAEMDGRRWTYADHERYPMSILLFDESVEVIRKLTAMPANSAGRKALGKLETIGSQGRALGFYIWALSQLAQKDVLGMLRDMIPQRLCLKQVNRINTEMVLGDGAEDRGAAASRIGDQPGFGYSGDEKDRGFQPFRATWCDQDDVERIARGDLPDGVGADHGKGEVNRQCAVYRFFDRHGQLLYVGITVNLQTRWKQHADSKAWWGEVDMAKTLVTWHEHTDAARKVEESEIRSRYPRYNLQHNGDNPIRGGSPIIAAPRPRLTLPRRRGPEPITWPVLEQSCAREFFDQYTAPVLFPDEAPQTAGRRDRIAASGPPR